MSTKQAMTKADRAYAADACSLGCMICRLRLSRPGTPAEFHHPRTGIGSGKRSPHSEGIPLCPGTYDRPGHHRVGPFALHAMGRKAFERHWQITEAELTAETKRRVALLRALRVTAPL